MQTVEIWVKNRAHRLLLVNSLPELGGLVEKELDGKVGIKAGLEQTR